MMFPQDTKNSEGTLIVYDSKAKKMLYMVELDYTGVPVVTVGHSNCVKLLEEYGIRVYSLILGVEPIDQHDFIHYYFLEA
jgi:hypothetical protein